MRVTITPSSNPTQQIDVTQALIGAVAGELWKHCGGNDVLNWVEAERFVESLALPPKALEPERKSRPATPIPRPSRPRDDAGRPLRRRPEPESERVTGPLPLY